MYDNFFTKAHELTSQGIPFATATVVRAEKPTSGKPGDKAIITLDGVMHGWIGGSCAQPTVIKEAVQALADDQSRLICLSTEPELKQDRPGLTDLPMTCFSGGTLEIYIEPQQPRPRLLIIGTLPVAQALAHLGHAMNYHVIAVDPDGNGTGMEHADEQVTDLAELHSYINPLTYVVVATHGNYDELALVHILESNVPYVGMVASKRRAASVRDYLLAQGLAEDDLRTLKAPAGLDIQARRGDEIALSIMAEIVQQRRNAEQLDWALFHDKPEQEADKEANKETDKETAIDPICQMEVQITATAYRSEINGKQFYFCCSGCQDKFERQHS